MATKKRHKAYLKLERMRKYGSRRVKTLIRQWRDNDAIDLLAIVKALK